MSASARTIAPSPRRTVSVIIRGLLFAGLVLAAIAASGLAPAAARAAGTVLVFGDSLSAAYGIGQKEGWPALLAERLRERNRDYSVVNASISGETTAGGATRIGEAIERAKPGIVIIALGGNDGLRGLPVAQMKANLEKMVGAAKAARAKVLLVGMRMPPNYGPRYTREFEAAFSEVAKQENVALVPFLLEGIGDRREMFLADTIHPTAAAQPVLLDNVWRGLEPLLR